MTVSKSLPQCSLPECLSDPNVAAAVECYTTLISLTSPSKSTTKLLEAISPISAAITSSNGLLGCTGGEVLRVDLSTKTAYSLSSASAGRPSSASHASFTGLSSATAAVASGFSRGKKSVDSPGVRDVFLSPNGLHGIIGFSNGENCYIGSNHSSSLRYKPLPSLKDIQVRSVCWNNRESSTPNTTNEILLGTSQGVVLSTVISNGCEQNVRSLVTLPEKSAVVRILVYELPKREEVGEPPSTTTEYSKTTPLQSVRLCILVATVSQLLLFVGGPTVEHAFASTWNGNELPHVTIDHINERILSNLIFECPKYTPFGELHSTHVPSNVISSFRSSSKRQNAAAQPHGKDILFWWLTGVGVIVFCLNLYETSAEISSPPLVIPFCNKLSPRNRHSSSICRGEPNTVFRLRYSLSQSTSTLIGLETPSPARSIAITEHHLLLLYESRLDVVSRITRQRVDSLSLPSVRFGISKSLITDSVSGTVYLLTSRYLFQVEIRNADLGLWRELISINDYPSALRTVSTSPRESDFLKCRVGELYLQDRRIKEAAEILADCGSIPFEDLLILFTRIHNGEEDCCSNATIALIDDRLRKLNAFSVEQKGQSSGSGTYSGIVEASEISLRLWALELVLKGLNSCEFDIERLKYLRKQRARKPSVTPLGAETLNKRINHAISERKRLLQIGHGLMIKLHGVLEKQGATEAVYSLCESLGRPEESRLWSTVLNDLNTQILDHLITGDYHSALMCLVPRVRNSDQAASTQLLPKQILLVARYGPQLFRHEPSTFSALLLRPHSLQQQADTSTSVDGIFRYLCHPAASSFLLPALIPSAVDNALGDLHRCEALKLLERFHSEMFPKAYTAKKQRASRRDHLVPLSWVGPSGLSSLLISLLAACRGTESELLKKLNTIMNGEFCWVPDLFYLLRFCCELGHRRAVVILLSVVGMHSRAVHVALDGQDLELAKIAVRRVPQTSEWRKRQLWKEIAKTAAKILEPPDLFLLLEESSGILRLHESLEYINSNDIIGAFRSELISAFESAEERLKEKQLDIDHNRKALSNLKAKIQRQKATAVQSLSLGGGPTGQESKEDYRRAVMALSSVLFGPEGTDAENLLRTQKLKDAETAIDAVLAEECFLCGVHMIEVIGTPFISKSDPLASAVALLPASTSQANGIT